MSADYIPRKDYDVTSWIGNFVDILTEHAEELDLTPEDIAPVADGVAAFDTALLDSLAKHTAARSATRVKETAREEVVEAVRKLAKRINAHSAMTPELRVSLGFRAIDTVRTSKSVGPEQPLTRLVALPGRVIVHFGPNPLNERMNARPSWANGCLIYRKGPNDTAFSIIGYATTSPYVDTIVGPGADYTYMVRYQGAKPRDLGVASAAETIAARGEIAA